MKRTPLELEKLVALRDLNRRLNRLRSSRPEVDTGLGFSVQGGYQDTQNLEGGRDLGRPLVRASDNRFYPVTPPQWKAIILAVKANTAQLFERKWQIEDAIKAADSLEALRAIDTNL